MDTQKLARQALAHSGRDPGAIYWEVVTEADGWDYAPGHEISAELYRLILADPAAARPYLARQAVVEHVGAATISAVGRRQPDAELRRLLRRHALDEARHARMLRRLLRDRFDSDVDQGFVRAALGSHHAFLEAFDGDYRRFVSDSHAAELRTLRKLRHMEAACDTIEPGLAQALRPVVEAIIVDEMEHIAYTAVLMGQWLAEGTLPRDVALGSIMIYDAKEWDEIGVLAAGLENARMAQVAHRLQPAAELGQAA